MRNFSNRKVFNGFVGIPMPTIEQILDTRINGWTWLKIVKIFNFPLVHKVYHIFLASFPHPIAKFLINSILFKLRICFGNTAQKPTERQTQGQTIDIDPVAVTIQRDAMLGMPCDPKDNALSNKTVFT